MPREAPGATDGRTREPRCGEAFTGDRGTTRPRGTMSALPGVPEGVWPVSHRTCGRYRFDVSRRAGGGAFVVLPRVAAGGIGDTSRARAMSWRTRSAAVVGRASCRACTGARLVLRSRIGVRSAREPRSTRRRASSSPTAGRSITGDGVTRAPEVTMPRTGLSAGGRTSRAGRTSRLRCGLAKSSLRTTFQPRGSTLPGRTWPRRSRAKRDAGTGARRSAPEAPCPGRPLGGRPCPGLPPRSWWWWP